MKNLEKLNTDYMEIHNGEVQTYGEWVQAVQEEDLEISKFETEEEHVDWLISERLLIEVTLYNGCDWEEVGTR